MKRCCALITTLVVTAIAAIPASAAGIANPSFEAGTLGQVPTSWTLSFGSVGPVSCTHQGYSVNTTYFDGARSMFLHSRAVDGGVAASQGCSTTVWSNPVNIPGADSVKFRIRNVSVTHTTFWGWLCHIYVLFSDGVNFAGYPVYGNGEVTNFNNYDYMATGADGASWYVYVEAIPPNIDRTNMQIGIGVWGGLWTWLGYYSDIKCNVDLVELVVGYGETLDSIVDLTPHFDWGAISSYPGLAPPGSMGIYSPTHTTNYYFPSDSLSPGSAPRAWLLPGVHLATACGPGNMLLPSNPAIAVLDRNSRPCSLFAETPPATSIDEAVDINVMQISAGESKTIPISGFVETLALLASCDGVVWAPGVPSPDQPLQVTLTYLDASFDIEVLDSIHPGERINNISSPANYIFFNEALGCGPAYYDLPSPYNDDNHSEFWHCYTVYPDTLKKLSSVTLTGLQSGAPQEEIYVSAMSYSVFHCCNQDSIRGDADNDCTFGCVNVADLSFLVAYLFQSGSAPVCEEEADADSDCTFGCVNVADLSYLVNFLFQSGPAPGPCPQ